MRPRHWMTVLRAFCLVALATSVALLVDYTGFNPAFCTSADSGCGAVRRSGLGYPLGIPMPVFGVAGFALLFGLSMVGSPLRRRFLPIVGGIGGVAAIALLVVQAVKVKTFCSLCVIVDGSGVLAGVAALLWARSQPATDPKKKKKEPDDVLKPWAWWALAVVALAAPYAWPKLKPRPPVPDAIRAYYQPGKINVVEFADYQCPFCRMLHPELKKIIADYPGQVNFVRLNLPLKSHPFAFDAAKAAVCGEKLGKGDELADALFATEDLSTTSIRRVAVGLGIDAEKFDKCLADPETVARIRREEEILRGAGFEGLPTTYIGAEKIVGVRETSVFREAFDRAKRGEGNTGMPPWLFIGVLGLLVGTTVGLGRERR